MLVAGYSAYPRRVNFAKMREIADEVGATLMVDMAHFAGLVAGKVFTGDEDPVPFAHVTTTTTHKSLRGPRGGLVLAQEEYAPSVDRGCPMVLGGPLSHVMAAKAVALAEARQPSFQTYAQRIADNAKSLAEGFLTRGANLVTGGTDNHIVLLDVSSFGLTGRQAESALLDAGVVTNRNSVPADPNGAWYTSGIRLGTPALTTRGFGPRRVRPGRRADRRRARAPSPAPPRPAARRRRRTRSPTASPTGSRRLRRDARQAPALPGPRADPPPAGPPRPPPRRAAPPCAPPAAGPAALRGGPRGGGGAPRAAPRAPPPPAPGAPPAPPPAAGGPPKAPGAPPSAAPPPPLRAAGSPNSRSTSSWTTCRTRRRAAPGRRRTARAWPGRSAKVNGLSR